MAYCGPRGIPLSTFLSWDQHDQDAALAWASYEARRCQQCGHHPDEHGQVHAHVNICPGCEARAKARATDPAKEDGASVHLAGGHPSQCERCTAEARSNREHPTPTARPRARRRR